MDLPEIIGSYLVTKGMIDPAVAHLWQKFTSRLKRVVDIASTKPAALDIAEPIVWDERASWSVFDAAKVTDDPIVADYLAGVLAASGPGDDTGVPIAALIARLSSVDLRLHYVLYATFQQFIEMSVGVGEPESMRHPDVFVPTVELLAAIGLPADAHGIIRLEQALRNLGRERLVGQVLHNGMDGSPAEPFVRGSAEVTRWWKREAAEDGVVFAASADGMALMGWGLGLVDPSPLGYVTAVIPDEVQGVPLPACPSAIAVMDLPEIDPG